MSRQHKRRARIVRTPVTSALRDQFGMQLHTSLRILETAPDENAFNSLAAIFNVVQLAIRNDAKRTHEARIINGGAAALNQYQQRIVSGLPLHPHQITPVRVAVNVIDSILGRIGVEQLYFAMQTLRSLQHLPPTKENHDYHPV